MSAPREPRIGLALGGGSARGWAHIGVIEALEQADIHPDLVCGTSVGALVGAAYAAGELDRFRQWVLGMGIRDVVSFMDLRLNGGVLKGERVMQYFRRNFVDRPIEDLAMPFGAVATALDTGREVWLRTGSTVEAVRASIALPALFTPVLREGELLVDGALVNPVPVSLARAMGAEVVIAVDLSSVLVGRNRDDDTPSLLNVVAASLNIMQVRIARSRMAGDPPDAVVAPRLAHLGLLDFHRAGEAIEAGRRAVAAALPGLQALGIRAPVI